VDRRPSLDFPLTRPGGVSASSGISAYAASVLSPASAAARRPLVFDRGPSCLRARSIGQGGYCST